MNEKNLLTMRRDPNIVFGKINKLNPTWRRSLKCKFNQELNKELQTYLE